MTATEVDGRRLRRDQNRESVVDALIALFEEGVLDPSTAEVAERAGLSPRSLFRYFDDVEDLHRAAVERQVALAEPLVDPGVTADDPLPDRIAAVVAARMRAFDALAPSARAARVCAHYRPVIAAQVARSRAFLRAQVRALLGGAHVEIVDVLLSFEAYELLRVDQKLSRTATADALTRALTTLLGGSR